MRTAAPHVPTVLVLVLTAVAGVPPAARGAVLHVPVDHPTIQRAVNAARPHDVVRVAPGTYRESVRILGAKTGLVIAAADDAHPPVIRGTRNRSADGIRIDGVHGVGLRNLRIEGAYDAVRLNSVRDAVLVDLHLVDNALAVRVNRGRDDTILRCTIVGTRVEQGIRVDGSPGVTIADNVVARTDREAIRVLDSPDAVLVGNHVTESGGADGIKVEGSPRTSVERCTTERNYRNGIRVTDSPGIALLHNAAHANRNAGFRIEGSFPIRSAADVLAGGNRAAGNRAGDVVVDPPRCNTDGCDTGGTRPGTTSTTTTVPRPSVTTTTVPPGVAARWRFYVRLVTPSGLAVNADVPLRAALPPVEASIRAEHLPAFRLGDQVSAAQIAALGGDTLARLLAAAAARVAAGALDYRGATVLSLHWAKRVRE